MLVPPAPIIPLLVRPRPVVIAIFQPALLPPSAVRPGLSFIPLVIIVPVPIVILPELLFAFVPLMLIIRPNYCERGT